MIPRGGGSSDRRPLPFTSVPASTMATEKRVVFRSAWLPYALVAPQIAITVVFFFWPAVQAVWYSFQLQDAFGLQTEFVGLRNFVELFHDPRYLDSFRITAVFSFTVAGVGIVLALLLATMANRVVRGALAYKTFLIWPYAVASAVAGVLFAFLFAPSVGIVTFALQAGRHRLELGAAGRPGDDPGGDRVDLEADQLQLPVLPRRPAVDPASR